MEPILVRPLPAKGRKGKKKQYQIISGHNRVYACKKLGMTEAHGIVEQMDDDTATLKMVDANLKQRQGLLISERALAYKLVFDIYKKPGHRYDLDEEGQPRDNFVAKSIRASDVIGSEENKSGRTVERLYAAPFTIKRACIMRHCVAPCMLPLWKCLRVCRKVQAH